MADNDRLTYIVAYGEGTFEAPFVPLRGGAPDLTVIFARHGVEAEVEMLRDTVARVSFDRPAFGQVHEIAAYYHCRMRNDPFMG